MSTVNLEKVNVILGKESKVASDSTFSDARSVMSKAKTEELIASALQGASIDQGNFTLDPLNPAYPTNTDTVSGGAIKRNYTWTIKGLTASESVVLGNETYTLNDTIKALADNPGVIDTNWTKSDADTDNEKVKNKVSDITGFESDEDKYPNAKALVDYVDAVKTDLESQIAVGGSILTLYKKIGYAQAGTPVSLGSVLANYTLRKVCVMSQTAIDVSATLKIGKTGAEEFILSAVDIGNLNTYNTIDGNYQEFYITNTDGSDMSFSETTELFALLTQTGATAGLFRIDLEFVKN